MSETENQEEKKPELEINKGVELMLRNKNI